MKPLTFSKLRTVAPGRVIFAVTAALSLLLAGCDDRADRGPRLQTDSTAYTMKRDGRGWLTSIGYSYRNSGTDTVYIGNCNGQISMVIEERYGATWRHFWVEATDACMSAPIVIAPGGAYAGHLRVWGADAGNASTTAFLRPDFDGRFRLVWH